VLFLKISVGSQKTPLKLSIKQTFGCNHVPVKALTVQCSPLSTDLKHRPLLDANYTMLPIELYCDEKPYSPEIITGMFAEGTLTQFSPPSLVR